MSHTTMKTAIAISPMMRNVLNVAKIPPAAVKASQSAKITPRTVAMIRPMFPVCALRHALNGVRSSQGGLALRARTSRHRGLPSSRRPRAVKGTVVTVNPAAIRSFRTAGSGQVR